MRTPASRAIAADDGGDGSRFERVGGKNGRVRKLAIETVLAVFGLRKGKKQVTRLNLTGIYHKRSDVLFGECGILSRAFRVHIPDRLF